MIETDSLIIRPFSPSDWEGLQALAVDKETLRKDPHDPPWPTSDEGSQGFAEYLAVRTDQYFAVCLKANGTLIGLLAFNHIDEDGQIELGYQIHSVYQDLVHDQEALEAIIEHAFAAPEVLSVDTRTNGQWSEQIAPLQALGFWPIDGELGHLGISKARWRERT